MSEAVPDTPRVDATDKVRGETIFGADDARPVTPPLRSRQSDKGTLTSTPTRRARCVGFASC